MPLRRFWVELAHPSIRFGCSVTAKSADEALAIVRSVVERGDVVVGEEPGHVAAVAEQLRRRPPSGPRLIGEVHE